MRFFRQSEYILQDLVFVVEDCVKEMQEVFKEGIEDKCKLGAEYVSVIHSELNSVRNFRFQAAENAVQLVDDFAGSVRSMKAHRTELY